MKSEFGIVMFMLLMPSVATNYILFSEVNSMFKRAHKAENELVHCNRALTPAPTGYIPTVKE